MDFATFLNAGWTEHADDPEGVFGRLGEGIPLATVPEELPRLAGLVVHVSGEHLGRWADGEAMLQRLADAPLLADDAAARASIHRSRAVLRWCAGDRDGATRILGDNPDPGQVADSVRVRMLAVAASALAGRGRADDATAAFTAAVEAASYGPAASDPAARSLAITGNNLACALEEREDRSPAETELMKQAAATARRWWEVAGDWRNVALAEARLCFTHVQAGEPGVALDHALAAVALCDANAAGPDDRLTPLIAVTRARIATGELDAARESFEALEAALEQVDEQVRGWYVDSHARLRADLGG